MATQSTEDKKVEAAKAVENVRSEDKLTKIKEIKTRFVKIHNFFTHLLQSSTIEKMWEKMLDIYSKKQSVFSLNEETRLECVRLLSKTYPSVKERAEECTHMMIKSPNEMDYVELRCLINMQAENWIMVLWDALTIITRHNVFYKDSWLYLFYALCNLNTTMLARATLSIVYEIDKNNTVSQQQESITNSLLACNQRETQFLSKLPKGVVEQFENRPTYDLTFSWVGKLPTFDEYKDHFKSICIGFPIIIEPTAGYGNGIVASRNIKKGEAILNEIPVLAASLSITRCFHCFKSVRKDTPVFCQLCKRSTMLYCSQQCFDSANDLYHPVLCGKGYRTILQYAAMGCSNSCKIPLMMMRLVATLIHKNLHTTIDPSTVGMRANFNITKNFEILKNMPLDIYIRSLALLWDMFDLSRYPQFDIEWYLKWSWFINNNAYGYTYKGDQAKCEASGVAYYSVASFFNHSCVPNAKWVIDSDETGNNITVTATKNIAKGEQVFIAYIDTNRSYKDRQNALYQYCFTCKCPRCCSESKSSK